MKSYVNNFQQSVFSFVIVLIFLTMVFPVSANTNPGVVQIDETLQNDKRTYSQLSGDWWNWLSQFPIATNPNIQEGEIECSLGQSDHIWFLAGNFGGTSERSCTIPMNKALFFPILNSLWWTPEDAATIPEVRAFANFFMNKVTSLEVSVNDVPLEDLFAYRAQSPAGGFFWEGILQEDFGLDPYPRPSAADGFWILLKPLAVGDHVIHIRGVVLKDPPDIRETFELDITYNITVVDEGS